MVIDTQCFMANLDEINETNTWKNFKPAPIEEVGEYCEGEDSNTTIPVSYQGVNTFAILDSGAGVAIATKGIWEA